MPHRSRVFNKTFLLLCGAFCLLVVADSVRAQSTDPTFPTPVGSKEIDGAIPARDLGDSRLTDQYYGFVGMPGDLILTVQTKNFNGDFDIFTAGDLRPLLKITVYAELDSPIRKNIYLRRRENLILRVEGRTPNDDDATYEIRFTGSFEPIPGGVLLAKADRPAAQGEKESGRTSNRRGSRVSSVGGRIEEPPTEVAAAPTPEPNPEPTPALTATPEVAKTESTEPAKKPSTQNTARRGTTGRPSARSPSVERTKTARTQDTTKDEAEKDTAKAEQPTANSKPTADEKPKPEPSEPETKVSTPRPTNERRTSTASRTSKTKPEDNGAQLDIERKDGTHLKMGMRMITRVTVENGQILIVTKDGALISVPMSNVARMSIGP